MQSDRIVLRPRSQAEAMDLGFHLARANWPALCALTLIGLAPACVLAVLAFSWFPPLAVLFLWWIKPSLDRPLLYLLAQDLVGQPARVGDILRDWPRWWRGGHLASLLYYRFHPALSTVLPIWQLERLKGRPRRQRAKALAHGGSGSGVGLTVMLLMFQACLLLGLVALTGWLLPSEVWASLDITTWLEPGHIAPELWALLAIGYAVTVALVEPFYIGGGFGLYLNQRCRLECWDLEPALKELVARHTRGQAA
ncbi:MAG: hypothetical protein ACNA7J_05410 [Wenzhouxiangella sp.]